MVKFKWFFGLAVSLALFSSCRKADDEPQTPEVTQQDCRLSKVLDQNNNPVTEITYNSQNQYTSFINHSAGSSFTFTYTNNKISAVSHAYLSSQPVPFIQSFEMNADGFLEKLTYADPVTSTPELYFPHEYNANNKLIKTGIYGRNPWGTDEHRTSETFEYSNNNVVKFTSIVFRNPVDTTIHVTDIEYDNKSNPFARFRNFTSSTWYWSDNNPIKNTRTEFGKDGTVISKEVLGNYLLEYNADDLLIKSTYIPTNGSAPTIRKYEYICN